MLVCSLCHVYTVCRLFFTFLSLYQEERRGKKRKETNCVGLEFLRINQCSSQTDDIICRLLLFWVWLNTFWWPWCQMISRESILRAPVFLRDGACIAGGGRSRIMIGFQGLKQEFPTERGLDIMKDHLFKVIPVLVPCLLNGCHDRHQQQLH